MARVQQSNFDGYPLLRMPDAPHVEVYVMPSAMSPCGAGEMGIPSAPPALANAIFAATGKRLRRLPLLSEARYDCPFRFPLIFGFSVQLTGRGRNLQTTAEGTPP